MAYFAGNGHFRTEYHLSGTPLGGNNPFLLSISLRGRELHLKYQPDGEGAESAKNKPYGMIASQGIIDPAGEGGTNDASDGARPHEKAQHPAESFSPGIVPENRSHEDHAASPP